MRVKFKLGGLRRIGVRHGLGMRRCYRAKPAFNRWKYDEAIIKIPIVGSPVEGGSEPVIANGDAASGDDKKSGRKKRGKRG